MFDAPVGFAFSAGAVAAFNPCGFALLPAYLGMYLAGDDPAADEPAGDADLGRTATRSARSIGRLTRSTARASAVALAVVSGFVAVFGIAALLISRTAVTVQEYTPWMTLVIGAALVPAGVAMMRGWTPKLRLPAVNRRVSGTDPIAMFWFGVSYATVSLSCTIPAFLVAVVGTFSEQGTGSGALVFASYTTGMASVLVVVTVVVATARHGVLTNLRRVLPYVNTAAGGLAVVAGAYVAYYGWYEINLNNGGDPSSGPITFVGDLSGTVTTWVDGLPPAALLAVPAVLGAVVLIRACRSRRASAADTRR